MRTIQEIEDEITDIELFKTMADEEEKVYLNDRINELEKEKINCINIH